VHLLKSNVILIVSTGEIGPEARKYADVVMKDSNLCIAMIDGADVRVVERDPAAIVDILHREARSAMKIKKLEI
jgi:site-specific DNA-methyltransferase (cytosine-N4-specific)